MRRKLTVAFCLCFIVLFVTLWNLRSNRFPKRLPSIGGSAASKSVVPLEEDPKLVKTVLVPTEKDFDSNAWKEPRSTKLVHSQTPFPDSPAKTTNGIQTVTSSELQTRSGRIVLVFWSTVFGHRLNLHESWGKDKCPVECEVTSNIKRSSNASAFIVHARDPRPLPPSKDIPWIMYTQENPVFTPALQDQDYMMQFKLLKSYRLDSDFPDPTFTKPDFSPPLPFKNKTGFIMAVFSHCEPVRMEYMRQLMEFVDVDSYGRCNPTGSGGLLRHGGGRELRERKTELARRYKFLLVFFNADCDYFVDDQLLHALNAGTIPVVMGTDKIGEFMPGNLRHAYIEVRNFTSTRHLANYLKFLRNNETEYNKYLEWKFKGFGDINGTAIGNHFFPKYAPYCQVCVAVAEGRVHEEGLKADYCQRRKFKDWDLKVGAIAEEIARR